MIFNMSATASGGGGNTVDVVIESAAAISAIILEDGQIGETNGWFDATPGSQALLLAEDGVTPKSDGNIDFYQFCYTDYGYVLWLFILPDMNTTVYTDAD